MKSEMPFYGVSAKPQRAIFRELFAKHPLPTFAAWKRVVLQLWRDASFREERYAAVELTGHRLYREHQTLAAIPIYEEMIVTGAWWDLVDVVAIHRVGPLLEKYPAVMKRKMFSWRRSKDLWKRRTSIICQVARKERTDLELLYACIEANASDRDFFIRKAIGWALRSYAYVDPKEVRRYVGAHPELSGLSKREALKNV